MTEILNTCMRVHHTSPLQPAFCSNCAYTRARIVRFAALQASAVQVEILDRAIRRVLKHRQGILKDLSQHLLGFAWQLLGWRAQDLTRSDLRKNIWQSCSKSSLQACPREQACYQKRFASTLCARTESAISSLNKVFAICTCIGLDCQICAEEPPTHQNSAGELDGMALSSHLSRTCTLGRPRSAPHSGRNVVVPVRALKQSQDAAVPSKNWQQKAGAAAAAAALLFVSPSEHSGRSTSGSCCSAQWKAGASRLVAVL